MKTMLITGGSRGIGAATAYLAAKNGFAVIVNYHQNQAAAQQVVSDIIEKGGKAAAIQADISKEEDIVRLLRKSTSFSEKCMRWSTTRAYWNVRCDWKIWM